MAPMSSSNATDENNRRTLLTLAGKSIHHGIQHGAALPVECSVYPPELSVIRATFVTLQKNGALRGCIGTLQPVRPLLEDVAHNAYAAAFNDPRFQPVEAGEVDALSIHLSILTPAQSMQFSSEQDLIRQLRPGCDGLIIEDGLRRGTFLPSVWDSLSDPALFLQHLKQKAGLPADHWSDTLKVYRYTTEVIE